MSLDVLLLTDEDDFESALPALKSFSETVRRGLTAFIQLTGADELILNTHVYDHAARLKSFEIVAGLRERLEGSFDAGARAQFGHAAQH